MKPEVSVVMGVYNGEKYLRESIESILEQKGVELEFIIVNDGSTDRSPSILQEYASSDKRVKVLHQENMGLTGALINGCVTARGKYIARQDAGDISLPGRLKIESDILESQPDVALVSCGTRFLGPCYEHLYDRILTEEEEAEGLLEIDLTKVVGPSQHGSTMFRRSEYFKVGGYRPCFHVAQDLDLWLRLTEKGRHVAISDILYQALIALNSISGLYRKRQIQTAKIILECAKFRRAGMTEELLLKTAKRLGAPPSNEVNRRNRADTLYFIGRCLHEKQPQKARQYYKHAIEEYPFHMRALWRLMLHFRKRL